MHLDFSLNKFLLQEDMVMKSVHFINLEDMLNTPCVLYA